MSAHPTAQRGGWLTALVARAADFVFEEVEETVESAPVELKPHPVVAVVAATPRAGATTVARLLAAELATRAEGTASVVASGTTRRSAPPSRAAMRLATALTGVGNARPAGRLCMIAPPPPPPPARPPAPALDADRSAPIPALAVDADRSAPIASLALDAARSERLAGPSLDAERIAGVVQAARYLAPVVVDLPADGSAAGVAAFADRIVVVTAASAEPALLDAVAGVVGGSPIKVVNRVADAEPWADRADFVVPDSRLAARASTVGTRALGSIGSAIAALADALEANL